MEFREAALAKALYPMILTPAGIVTAAKEFAPKNAPFPMLVIPVGILMEVKEVA
jgi:hypothetical protein